MIIRELLQKADGTVRQRNYIQKDLIGNGGFAKCFVVERVEDKKQFAMKIIDKKMLQKPKSRQKMLSQISLHKIASHKHICKLERVFEDNQNVYMVLQLCRNGNMFEMIRRRKRLTIPEVQYYLYQLIHALVYLHSRKIVHRDVKLGNILINDQMQLKLADFGLAVKLQFQGDRKHTVCGTPNYIAPEVIISGMGLGPSGHSYEVDVWSTGVILYFMLIGRSPFESKTLDKIYSKVVKAQFTFPQNFKDTGAKDLIRKILTVKVEDRFTFQDVLNHQFMNPKQGIPKELPLSSMNTPPLMDNKSARFDFSQVKESARSLSGMSLRSSNEIALDFEDSSLNEQKPKAIRGLIKTVFTSSTMSRSLQKIALLKGRSVSKDKKAEQLGSRKMLDRSRLMTLGDSCEGCVDYYVAEFHKDLVMSYMMSSGYLGAYSTKYKLLYNRTDQVYLEGIEDGPLVQIKNVIGKENIENRVRFFEHYKSREFICEPFINAARVVHITKIFEVAAEKVILFRLSNNTLQAHSDELKCDLLVTDTTLTLLHIEKSVLVSRHVQQKNLYIQSKNKTLVTMYLKVKKITAMINSKKKN